MIQRIKHLKQNLLRFHTFVIGAALCTLPAHSQDITQNFALDFGTVAVIDNNSNQDLNLDAAGSFSIDPGMIDAVPPTVGDFTITGYPPGTQITLSFNDPQTFAPPSGTATFSFHDPVTTPSPIVVDGSGEANFTLGGILRTNGNGILQGDGPFTANIQITATPLIGIPVSETFPIDVENDRVLDTNVISNIEMGTVAAYAEAGRAAPLTITPFGTLIAGTDGNAFTIISDQSSTSPGEISITGVAPNATINYHIQTQTPPSGPLGHQFIIDSYQVSANNGAPVTGINSGDNNTFTADANYSTDETLNIGLILTTPNMTGLMADGNYNGSFTIDIGY